MIDVVAAIIPCNNSILLCQRSESSIHPLEWEFPGGKIQTGEQSIETLKRELDEELKLEVKDCRRIYVNTFTYKKENVTVKLQFYVVQVKHLNFTNQVFNKVEFVKLENIHKKNLLEADRQFWPYILEVINTGNLLYRFNNGG